MRFDGKRVGKVHNFSSPLRTQHPPASTRILDDDTKSNRPMKSLQTGNLVARLRSEPWNVYNLAVPVLGLL